MPGAGDWPTDVRPLGHPRPALVEAVALTDISSSAARVGDDQRATAFALEALGLLGQRFDDLLQLDLPGGVLDGPAVAEITLDLLDGVLGRPSTLLAAYGALRPGASLAHVAEPLGGTWSEGSVRGTVRTEHGWSVLRPHDGGPDHAVGLLRSDALTSSWAHLDEVEGPHYRRAPVVAQVDGGCVVATAYVAADTDPLPGVG